MRISIPSVAICGACFIACTPPTPELMPRPATTEYFKDLGGGFISSGNTLTYAIQIQPRKPVNGPNTWYAQIEFENPENPQKPLVQFIEFKPDEASFSLHSETIHSIKNHKTYKVILKAFQNPERTTLITIHETHVRFDIPDQLAASWGLKLL